MNLNRYGLRLFLGSPELSKSTDPLLEMALRQRESPFYKQAVAELTEKGQPDWIVFKGGTSHRGRYGKWASWAVKEKDEKAEWLAIIKGKVT